MLAHVIQASRFALWVLMLACTLQATAQQVVKTVGAGGNPTQIVVNPASNKWFVALGTGGWAMGDGATGAVTTFTSFGDDIKFGAVNPITNRVYFVRNGTAPMAVNATTGVNSAVFSLGIAIEAIVVNPFTGYYYMLHKTGSIGSTVGTGVVTWFDVNDGGSQTNVTSPAMGAVNGATNTIYFASDAADRTLTKMSGTTQGVTGTTTMSNQAVAMVVNPVNNKVYVTTPGPGLLVFDGDTLAEGTPITVCLAGTALALDPSTNRIYVACPTGQVAVVDSATDTIVTNLAVGTNPTGLAVDIVENKVYVANQGAGTVTVIDAATFASQTVTVGTAPAGIALNPVTGKVFVANSGSGNVSVIDRSTYAQTAGPSSFWAAVNPVTGKAYISNFNGGSTLTVLDGASNATLGTPNVGTGAFKIAIDPVLNQVYVGRDDGQVIIVSGSTEGFANQLTVGSVPRALDVNPATHRVYVANQGSNTVSVIDGVTQLVIATIPVGTAPQVVAVNAETNRIFVGNGGSSNVSVIDGASNAVVQTIGVGGPPVAIAVNPVTNRIYVADNSASLREIIGSTVDTSPVVNLHLVGGNVNDVAVDVPNNKVWATANSVANVAVIDPLIPSVDFVTVGSSQSNLAIDSVRNKIYVSRNSAGTIVAIDGATRATTEFGVGSFPQRAAVNPVNGKVYVARASTPLAIIEPSATSFTQHKAIATVVNGFGGGLYTTSANPTLDAGPASVYSPAEPVVRTIAFRQADSQGAHATTTSLAGPNGPYQPVLSGLTKGINYVSLFALDAMAGSSTSSESGAIGASPTITGAPTVLTVVVTDAPAITQTTLPDGRVGTAYTASVTATGGVPSYNFASIGGLPPGVSIAASGSFAGTPSAAGTYNFSIMVTDSLGASSSRNYSLTIAPDAVISTNPATNLAFSIQAVGYAAPPQSVTVTSAGTSSLVVGAPAISGLHAGDFGISSNNCATVAPTASCTMQITFTPSALSGRAATLDIPSNDPTTPIKSIALSGVGVAVDDLPNIFGFTDVTGVARNSVQTSNTISVDGINVPASISVSGSGGYSIGCTGTFITTDSTVVDGDTVCVRHTASSGNFSGISTTLSIGTIAGTRSDTFTSTTLDGFTLTAATAGAGSGTITGTGFNCPGDCSELVDTGTVVILTAAPATGSAFVSWSGCDSVTTTQCTVTVTTGRTATATFAALTTYNVVLEGWQQVAPYVVTGASGSGTATFNSSSLQLTLNLTYAGLTGTENGAHIHGPAARGANAAVLHALAAGSPKVDVVTLTPTEATQLANGQLYVNIHTTAYPNGEIRGQLDSMGAMVTRALTVTKTGGGSVTGTTEAGLVIDCGVDCSETVPNGKAVTLTATPDAGFALQNWGGACSGPTTCMVTMDAAKSVSATFVSLGSDLGTTITATPNPAVAGQDVTFTLTVSSAGPEAGDGVSTWAFIPSGATFVSASAGCSQTTLGPNPIVACFPNVIAVGATSQHTFVLRRAAPGTLTVNADVSSSKQDPAAGNNQSSVSVTVNPSTRLGNISTRMRVGTGSDVLIGGFIIGGSASKRVAIVATGPSLTQYGIANALAHPTLSLVRQSDQATIAINDGWQSAGNAAQLTAAGFAPSDALESAILIDLAPGAYTAIVQGASGGTGVGIVAVYEVDHPEVPLINISTRGQVLTGNDVMIGGFIVNGSTSQTVAIVATGPSLTQYGIANALANPTLSLVRQSDQTVIATNDDWQTTANVAQLQAAGFAPSNPLESAIFITLPPGAYTAILSGAGGGTGVGIIGVYAVP